jgi:hypothetical protein
MIPRHVWFLALFCAVLGVCVPTASAFPDSSCPVSFEHLDLRYNHAGGVSVPQLKLAFTNRVEKTISYMVIGLTILDPEGNAQPYPKNLAHKTQIPPGNEQRLHTWTLDTGSVDMHHTGESVTLLNVEYTDGTAWKDDGSLACTLSVDFHAK